MLSVSKLTESARECLGWPYVSPGTNDENGIDCSGLWVKCCKDQGAKIYHGSNTIFHEYCSETGKLTSESQLQPGMPVFKRKDWTDADKSNRWYGKEPGNLSHIGMVLTVNPLQIIHASSAAGCVTIDTKIGKWAYWGKEKDVDYSGYTPDPSPDPEPVEEKTMKVYAENGKPVRLRAKPSLNCGKYEEVPVGEEVTVSGESGRWSKCRWKKKSGWMISAYLVNPDTPTPEPVPDPDPDPDPVAHSATVCSDNGKPVKLRASKTPGTKNYGLYDELPVGTVVTVTKYADDWCQISYRNRKGWYMMTKFLSFG